MKVFILQSTIQTEHDAFLEAFKIHCESLSNEDIMVGYGISRQGWYKTLVCSFDSQDLKNEEWMMNYLAGQENPEVGGILL